MVAHLVIVAHLDCFVLSNVEDVELEESPNTIVVNPSHLAEPGPESDLLDLGVPTQERFSSASMFVSSKKSAIFSSESDTEGLPEDEENGDNYNLDDTETSRYMLVEGSKEKVKGTVSKKGKGPGKGKFKTKSKGKGKTGKSPKIKMKFQTPEKICRGERP